MKKIYRINLKDLHHYREGHRTAKINKIWKEVSTNIGCCCLQERKFKLIFYKGKLRYQPPGTIPYIFSIDPANPEDEILNHQLLNFIVYLKWKSH